MKHDYIGAALFSLLLAATFFGFAPLDAPGGKEVAAIGIGLCTLAAIVFFCLHWCKKPHDGMGNFE